MSQSRHIADAAQRKACAFWGLMPLRIEPHGSGLINHTWAVWTGGGAPSHILQKINTAVFTQPSIIDENLAAISAALRRHVPDYLFMHPLVGQGGATLCEEGGYAHRAFDFLSNSVSHDRATVPSIAYEAALQFGRFARVLAHVPTGRVRPSILQFHDLGLRTRQFDEACALGNALRIAECAEDIVTLRGFAGIHARFSRAMHGRLLVQRLMHHDTKISNVLFDARTGRGLCVCDLDTVMPGYFLSDVGDMMRTYLCPWDENHTKPDDLFVRKEFYEAIQLGYLEEMADALTAAELALFPLAGSFMIYIQALRFLTDYFNNDRYYGARYPSQNLDRARNQISLLQRYTEAFDPSCGTP